MSRPLFEGFVRASWLLNCASDDDVGCFVKRDKIRRKFGEMLEDVEKAKAWPRTLTEAKKNVWNAMHSYTHGGLNQVLRRIEHSAAEPVVDEEEIGELVCFSELIGFLTFIEVIGISKVAEKHEVLKGMMESVSEGCFKA